MAAYEASCSLLVLFGNEVTADTLASLGTASPSEDEAASDGCCSECDSRSDSNFHLSSEEGPSGAQDAALVGLCKRIARVFGEAAADPEEW